MAVFENRSGVDIWYMSAGSAEKRHLRAIMV